MSLTSALNTAQAIFNNTGSQSSVVSNNIANASNTNYTRRQASISTTLAGASVVQISRADEPYLQTAFLTSTSKDAAQQTVYQGLDSIDALLGGSDSTTSPAAYLTALQSALQTYAASPSSTTAAQSAVTAAQDVATSLNTTTTSIQALRASADSEISDDVTTLNNLLAQFGTANNAVQSAVSGSSAQDDAMDTRDSVLQQIAGIVGITTVTRSGNDMAIYTSDGTPLYDTVARTVTFKPTNTYTASTVGNGVYIDGTPLAAGTGATTTGQGTLQGLLQVRDSVLPTYQSQLDEIGRGLVTMFSETTTDGGTPPTTLSTQPGLFTWTDSDGDAGDTPTSDTIINGIAGTISVNPNVVTSLGGDPSRLRDGTVNDDSTSQNTAGNSGFSSLLDTYSTDMDSDMTFDAATGLSTTSSIMDFASNSVGWVEGYRSSANTAAENTSAALSRSSEAYSNETGVSLDEELSLMMDIEQSYKAGAKILTAVDDMLTALMQTVS